MKYLKNNYKAKLLIPVSLTLLLVISFCCIHPLKVESAGSSIYADKSLSSNCTGGNYSIASRNCSGSNGNAYKTITEAIAALQTGGTLYIRSGDYYESVTVGAYAAMTTINSQPGENVVWHPADRSYDTVRLQGNANNLTFKDLNFKGERYYSLNRLAWEQYQGNVWRTTSAFNEVVELNSGCNANTYDCTKTVRGYDGESKDSPTDLLNTGADGDYYQDPYPSRRIYIYSTSGSPASRNDIWIVGMGITIGTSSSDKGLIVVDHCSFDGIPHVHLKGGFKWWVKNSTFKNAGTDWNDHHIYTWGVHSAGQEAIYENNYFDVSDPSGAAIHLYGYGNQQAGVPPKYHIIRNNLITSNSFWGLLIDGSNSKIYNNTIYMHDGGNRAMNLQNIDSQNNEIKNNIMIGSSYGSIIFEGSVANHVIANNISFGARMFKDGACTGCTFTNNKENSDPKLVSSTPQNWSDFKLQASSPAIDTGLNLGTANQWALNPNAASWPAGTVDQNTMGSAWEVGAFAYGTSTTIPACTSFTYSEWETCTAGTQSRTIVSSTPSGCTGGTPVLTQTCTALPDCGPMDSNGDGQLTIADFAEFGKVYKTQCVNSATTVPACGRRDSNSNGTIDISDFGKFGQLYKQGQCVL